MSRKTTRVIKQPNIEQYICACPDICPLAFVLVTAMSHCCAAEGTKSCIESMGVFSLTYFEAVFSNKVEKSNYNSLLNKKQISF